MSMINTSQALSRFIQNKTFEIEVGAVRSARSRRPRTRRAGVPTCPGDRSPATLLQRVLTFRRPEKIND